MTIDAEFQDESENQEIVLDEASRFDIANLPENKRQYLFLGKKVN